MSELNTQPIFKCKICGAPVVLTHLETAVNDPDGKLLYELTKRLGENALCKYHEQMKAWYYSQNRVEEWEKGMIRVG
jgi:hypothetical protein